MVSNYQIILLEFFCVIKAGYVFTSEDLNYKTSDSFIPCEDGWYYFGGRCYKIGGYESDDAQVTMRTASLLCSEMGGKLASIHSKEENDFVTFFLALNVKQIAWIGLHDREQESHFVWEDGSPLDYANWDSREPSDHLNNEDCVELRSDPYTKNAGKWNDLNCDRKLAYICQKESNDTMKTPDPRFCIPDEGGGWKFRNSCYNLVNDSKSWAEAEEFCKNEFNGHLVNILDYTHDNYLGYIFKKYRTHAWIGIKKQDAFQQMWTSNMPVAYNRFDESLEDIENGSCILRWNRKLWTSTDCGEKLPFICEKNSDIVPILKPAPEEFRCPETPRGWRDLGGEYCYYIDTESSVSWVEAQIDCIKRGGLLVSIKSKEEERILHHFVKDTQSGILIGLNNVLTNGQLYIWSDGKKPIYTNWAANEPNSKQEKCAIVWTGDMKWNDVSCSYKSGFICQTKKVPVGSVMNTTQT